MPETQGQTLLSFLLLQTLPSSVCLQILAHRHGRQTCQMRHAQFTYPTIKDELQSCENCRCFVFEEFVLSSVQLLYDAG